MAVALAAEMPEASPGASEPQRVHCKLFTSVLLTCREYRKGGRNSLQGKLAVCALDFLDISSLAHAQHRVRVYKGSVDLQGSGAGRDSASRRIAPIAGFRAPITPQAPGTSQARERSNKNILCNTVQNGCATEQREPRHRVGGVLHALPSQQKSECRWRPYPQRFPPGTRRMVMRTHAWSTASGSRRSPLCGRVCFKHRRCQLPRLGFRYPGERDPAAANESLLSASTNPNNLKKAEALT